MEYVTKYIVELVGIREQYLTDILNPKANTSDI